MYYELYVDVLFLVNFTMDYLLLLLVWRMLRCSATHGSICVGAVIGSLMTCVIIVLPIPHILLEFILFHIAVNTCMIRVGLKIREIRLFLKAFLLLYIGAFLMGGILTFFQQYVKMGSLFLFFAIGGYYIALGIWNFISWIQRWNDYHCKVEIYRNGKKYEVNGLIDTGNGLTDPVTGKPVSILDRETANMLWGESQMQVIRYVPYRSIGKSAGVLPILQVEQMCIKRTKAYWIENPLIAVSEEKISDRGEVKVILNPNLF